MSPWSSLEIIDFMNSHQVSSLKAFFCTRSCNLILLSSLFHLPHSSLKSLHRYLETRQLYLEIIFPRYVIPVSITRLFPSLLPILDLFAPLVLYPSLSLVDILSSLHLQVPNLFHSGSISLSSQIYSLLSLGSSVPHMHAFGHNPSIYLNRDLHPFSAQHFFSSKSSPEMLVLIQTNKSIDT